MTEKLKVAETEFRKRQRRKVFRCAYCLLALFSTLISSRNCDAARLSARTALVAPIELSNKAQLHTKFTVRIDGEFWIEINYLRKFRFSAGHPAPLTEFSAHYIIEQDSKIIQQGGFTSDSKVPALVSGGHYAPLLGRFAAKKGVEYEISIKLGDDVPAGLPKSANVWIILDPRVPYSFWRGW